MLPVVSPPSAHPPLHAHARIPARALNTDEKAPGCPSERVRALTYTSTYPDPTKRLSVDSVKSIYYVVRGELGKSGFSEVAGREPPELHFRNPTRRSV